ncbi:hypothetical protein GBN26_02730 [Plesiomonas shigelloides]|nr:hypothetical protein GBN26_02730 [Plesiomonas shigelloides]HAD42368.1 hypothetical protein [Plesiomonas shigelloides]
MRQRLCELSLNGGAHLLSIAVIHHGSPRR